MDSSQGLVQVSMYDTPGDEDYSHMRPLSYPETDILLLCFDLSCQLSYQNIYTKVITNQISICYDMKLTLHFSGSLRSGNIVQEYLS